MDLSKDIKFTHKRYLMKAKGLKSAVLNYINEKSVRKLIRSWATTGIGPQAPSICPSLAVQRCYVPRGKKVLMQQEANDKAGKLCVHSKIIPLKTNKPTNQNKHSPTKSYSLAHSPAGITKNWCISPKAPVTQVTSRLLFPLFSPSHQQSPLGPWKGSWGINPTMVYTGEINSSPPV